MSEKKNLGFDLLAILRKFHLQHHQSCTHLEEWLSSSYAFTEFEEKILQDVYAEVSVAGDYMNEEELKAKLVSFLFYVAQAQGEKKIGVFYERPLFGTVEEVYLSVICDCMVATKLAHQPDRPYFFLQEFKKAKGEKKDPEAQMLVAMLIAQEQNADNKPVYGSYIIGTGFHFATLMGKNYCISGKIEVSEMQNLRKVVFVLRKLKELIENR